MVEANTTGAVIGMILGFGVCLYYLVGTRYFPDTFISMWRPDDVVAKMGELQAAVGAAADETAKAAAADALKKFYVGGGRVVGDIGNALTPPCLACL